MQRREFSSVLCAQSHSGYCNFTPFVKILSRADLFMYTSCSNGDMLTKLDQTNTSDQRRCPVSQSPGKLHPWLLNTQRINEKDRKWSHISPYNSCSLVLLTQTQYLTPTHTHEHTWLDYRQLGLSLLNLCMKTANILPGSQESPGSYVLWEMKQFKSTTHQMWYSWFGFQQQQSRATLS